MKKIYLKPRVSLVYADTDKLLQIVDMNGKVNEQSSSEEISILEQLNQIKAYILYLEEQNKVRWGEEDTFIIQRICQILNESKKYYADSTEIRNCIEWLNTLKDRYVL